MQLPTESPAAGNVFVALRVLAYVALAAVAGAIVYAGSMAVRYWTGIGV